jgi:hypothetical protein
MVMGAPHGVGGRQASLELKNSGSLSHFAEDTLPQSSPVNFSVARQVTKLSITRQVDDQRRQDSTFLIVVAHFQVAAHVVERCDQRRDRLRIEHAIS